MLRLPRVCIQVTTVFKTSSNVCVPEHEAVFITRKWHDRKSNRRFGVKIDHPADSPANNYWFDFPSIEMEWKRINNVYNRDDIEKLYPDGEEDFTKRLEAALEAYAANPVLPPTLAPKIAPPAVLELLEAFKDDIETPDQKNLADQVTKEGIRIAGVALQLGAAGITSVENVAAATLGELCRDNSLSSTVASAIRAAARKRVEESRIPADVRREKMVKAMREKTVVESEAPVGAIAL